MVKIRRFQYLSEFVAKVQYCPENSEAWGEFVIDLKTDELISERMPDDKWSRFYLLKAAAHVSSLWEKQNERFKRLENGDELCICWS